MFFYLDIRPSENIQTDIMRLQEGAALPSIPEANALYIQVGKQKLLEFEVPAGKFLLLGDPIFQPEENLFERIVSTADNVHLDLLFNKIKGHYYWFYMSSSARGHFKCGTSFGAIYPIYYHFEKHGTLVSSSAFTLARQTNADVKDKRNLLERLLFNYPFFNSTWWANIHLLDAHRYLDIGENSTKVSGTFEVSDYFGTPTHTTRDCLSELAALFQRETELFFPDEPFAVSLTGGFDGRTLVAAAQKANREFVAYSFGRPDSTDVSMPTAQATKIGIPYWPILLDRVYVEQHSLDSGRKFMQLTEYNGNWGRPHYHYAARSLSERTNYILTGNFGSELFRALHEPGVMLSEYLIRVFSSTDDSWKDYLRQAAQYWDKNFFKEEIESLIADIEDYLVKMQGWDANHKFYHFVFNEIFRKYFGAELVMQSTYLNNRTPYLNLHLFQELNKTIWSGVHARLFEKMKSKRMKGQVFYATFIRQIAPQLYHLNTNKGYSPADVLEPWRLPLLASRVVWHKYLNRNDIDDNSVEAFIQKYHLTIARQLTDATSSLFRPYLERANAEIPLGHDIDKHIKMYSIATGWQAADVASVPIAQNLPTIQT